MSDEKRKRLGEIFRGMGGAAVAFSGGVDSSVLLAVARAELGDRSLALLGRSPLVDESEIADALETAREIGARCRMVDSDPLADPAFAANPPDRCYLCKKRLFGAFVAEAADEGGLALVEGSNADDLADYRPGRRALEELDVRSPLVEAGFNKADIRALARKLGLRSAEHPSRACLASRVPYGEPIFAERLARIAAVERVVLALGVRQVRARDHGAVVRIEVGADEMAALFEPAARERIVEAAERAGFGYASLDLRGYRSGSLNDLLAVDEDGAHGEKR